MGRPYMTYESENYMTKAVIRMLTAECNSADEINAQLEALVGTYNQVRRTYAQHILLFIHDLLGTWAQDIDDQPTDHPLAGGPNFTCAVQELVMGRSRDENYNDVELEVQWMEEAAVRDSIIDACHLHDVLPPSLLHHHHHHDDREFDVQSLEMDPDVMSTLVNRLFEEAERRFVK